jgi:hypothetical protein
MIFFKEIHVAMAAKLGILPSTRNVFLKSQKHQKYYIMRQVLWPKEQPETLFISRTGEFVGQVV